jgi:hypothetical protein
MDQASGDQLIRTHLKALLLHLASRSPHPSLELEDILKEVIDELHQEVASALKNRAQLKLVESVDPQA